jgi:hypothetical protein
MAGWAQQTLFYRAAVTRDKADSITGPVATAGV